ncbi:MAG: DUF4173 domain-containing protein [Akkermansiaceae bacterium]|nr:DUF4173 domain-containing protein [Akkermansiaceae bacterium]
MNTQMPTSAPINAVPQPAPSCQMLPPVPTPEQAALMRKTAIRTEDPTWWRTGTIPFIVLLLAAAAGDLYIPHEGILGIGAGLAGLLLAAAIILLRKDLSRGEIFFITGLSSINCIALLVSGNTLNYILGLVLPLLLLGTPSSLAPQPDNNVKYRGWLGYWMARREQVSEKKNRFLRRVMPGVISLLAGIVLFLLFLTIFAKGNPVVQQCWTWLVTQWNELVAFLNISWDFWVHVLCWGLGICVFSLYALRRTYLQKTQPTVLPPAAGKSILPMLPTFSLLGINAAFLIATSTDIAFLWFNNIPEGISQTQYLHNGADSITWASVLAAGILIILFRHNGQARRSVTAKVAGYLLVLQTFLLAASVYLRLYHQITDYGFTIRRVLAAEFMLLGLAGLVVLVIYMIDGGRFYRYAKVCFGSMLLLLIAGGIMSPARLAATLNLRYMESHPHWKFHASDYNIGRFDEVANLRFAEKVFRQHPTTSMAQRLRLAALKVVAENSNRSWTGFNLRLEQDLPTAMRILGDPEIEAMAEAPEYDYCVVRQ